MLGAGTLEYTGWLIYFTYRCLIKWNGIKILEICFPISAHFSKTLFIFTIDLFIHFIIHRNENCAMISLNTRKIWRKCRRSYMSRVLRILALIFFK